MSHRVHANSIAAIDEADFSARELLILRYLRSQLMPRTDAEIARALGFKAKAAVRPRITEMCDRGVLGECRSVRDPETGKRVRTVHIVAPLQLRLVEA